MNNLNAMNSLFSTGLSTPSINPFLSTGSSVNFGSVLDQAMAQAKTPGDKAKVQWLQAEYSDQSVLSSMFSDPQTSFLGLGMSDLFGIGGPLGLPSWAYDVQRVMGSNSAVQQLMGINQQASQVIQSQFGNSVASLGLGGGINSLF